MRLSFPEVLGNGPSCGKVFAALAAGAVPGESAESKDRLRGGTYGEVVVMDAAKRTGPGARLLLQRRGEVFKRGGRTARVGGCEGTEGMVIEFRAGEPGSTCPRGECGWLMRF